MDFRINRRQAFLVAIDAFLIAAAFYLSLLLRFDFNLPATYLQQFKALLLTVIVIRLIIFSLFGLYRSLWQFASIDELNAVILAVTSSSAAIVLYTNMTGTALPRSVYMISWGLNIIFIGGVRFALRIYRRLRLHAKTGPLSRVLIFGAGSSGTIVLRELKRHFATQRMLAVGFVDDDPGKQRCSVQGVKVLGTRENIAEIVDRHAIDQIIIAMPSRPREEVTQITRLCSRLPVKLKILPGVYDFLNYDVTLNNIRPVQIEDLLGRKEVQTDLEEIAGYLTNETVLITGAGGSIGSELCRQALRYNPQTLLLLDHAENNVYDIEMELQNTSPSTKLVPLVADVRDSYRIDRIFAKHKPTVIFHAAAHKHVPLMEANRQEAIRNNVFGTKNVAEAAHRHQAKRFLLVSTDKAVNPTSVMGATKRVAEIVVQSLARKSQTNFCAVRFGNVLGSRGSVIPLFKKQIAEGGPLTVTHPEMTRYFMTIPEAVQLIVQAGAMGQKGEIFVLDMGEPVRISDLAHDLIRLSGLEPGKDIEIAYTGIRPGEKLYEEVLTAEEGTKTTKHDSIFVAKATDQNHASFLKEYAHLGKILRFDLTSVGDSEAPTYQAL